MSNLQPSQPEAAAHEPKHGQIQNVLDRLNRCVNEIDDFRRKISGEASDAPDLAKPESTTLLVMLNETPNAINNQCDRIQSLLNQLDDLIF